MKKAALILSAAICVVTISARAADWTDANNVTYTALKSINGGGSGYIATDFKPNGKDTVKFKFKPSTVSGNDCIYCSRYKNGSGYMAVQFSGFRIGSTFRIDSHSQLSAKSVRQYTCNTTKPLTAGTEYTLSADYYNAVVTINGTEQTMSGKDSMPKSSSTGFTDTGSMLVLLASHLSTLTDLESGTLAGISNKATGDLYYFQLWSYDGTLSHNLMPARRDSDSAVGLYDTVTKKFYPATAGSLTGVTYDASERAGKKWTGLGGDNKMSNVANWEGGVAPQAGDDIDFTIAVPFAAIEADIDATFGKIYLGAGDLPAFSGELSATGINDLERMTAYDTATDGFAFTLAAPSGQDLIWNGGDTENWNATDKSWLCNGSASAWYDHNNAVFNVDGATATLTKNAAPDALVFSQSATIAGTATLTVPTVSVAEGVAATITAPTDGELTKTGEGSLTLGSSRTEQTTLSEGTLKMASGAMLDWSKLTLGTDPAKPVSLNLGGATINADLTARMSATVGGAAGGAVAIDNGVITNTANLRVGNGSLTLGSGADVTMNASAERWVCVGGINSANEGLDTIDASLVLDGASITKNGTKSVFLSIGDFGSYPSKGTMIVKNGGSYTTDNSVYVAQGCEGHLVIDGEGSSFTSYQLLFCKEARCADDENGYVVVTNGGTLVVDRLGYGSGKGKGYFRFDGGTLRAKATNETLLPAHEKLHYIVGAEGGTIDNDGKNITIAKGFSGPGMIDLTGSGKTTFAAGVGVDAEGGVYVDTDTTLTINGATQSYLGMLILQKGSTLDIAIPASDIAAFAATELLIPEKEAVTLTSGGGAFGEGIYAICKMSGVTAEVGAKFAPLISTETLEFEWSVVDNTLMLTVGAIDGNTWTGGANNGNLSDPDNWYGRAVPTSGTATINTSGELTVGALFKPDVIVFPETCGAVTIAGENAITGIMAITNLSSSICTFEVPVEFADKILVIQNAVDWSTRDQSSVRFAGGVTGTDFAEGTARYLNGAYTLTAAEDWIANTYLNKARWGIPKGSSLTLPFSSDTSEIALGEHGSETGGAFTAAVVRTSARVSCWNRGEYVVTEELAVTLPDADRYISCRGGEGAYKLEKLTLGDKEKSKWFYFANSGDYYGDKNIWIGAGGLNFLEGTSVNTAYACGKRNSDVIRVYPWYSDYAIGTKAGSTGDIQIMKKTHFGTTDENGVARTVTCNGIMGGSAAVSIEGAGRFVVNNVNTASGAVTVTDTATLAINAGKQMTSGAMTVNSGATLEVASGEHTFEGGLTLNDGATLAFNFTKRAVTPQIAIAEGKTLTVKGAVKVKIPADSKWPTGGEKVLTTCGGFDAEGVTVSLAEGAPKWAKSVYVNDDGNIVLDVKPMGTRVIVR